MITIIFINFPIPYTIPYYIISVLQYCASSLFYYSLIFLKLFSLTVRILSKTLFRCCFVSSRSSSNECSQSKQGRKNTLSRSLKSKMKTSSYFYYNYTTTTITYYCNLKAKNNNNNIVLC